MGNPKHTIELNGRIYDAATGAVLKHPEAAPTPVAVATGTVVDGFTRRKHTVAAATPAVHHPKRAAAAPKAVKHAAKKPQRSLTLMRTAVHKPKQHLPAAAPGVVIHPKHIRAHTIAKSSLVSRFGSTHDRLAPHVAPLPVQAPPEEASHMETAPPLHHKPAPVAHRSPHARASKIEHAMRRADSHTQPKIKKAKLTHRTAARLRVTPRLVRVGSGALAALLIAGFIVYQNIPNLAMRVAATRAGMSATLPGYQPAGFRLSGAIEYSTGRIKVSYLSNSDDRSFRFVQQRSDWDSDTLRQQHVAVGNRPYQTYQDKGRTIYIYDGSNAAWVEQGVWYQIEGNSALNSDQLLRLAASI